MFIKDTYSKSKFNFENYTFILPSISTGNVGQLSVDTLITSWKCKRIGYFYDGNVTSLVGNDATVKKAKKVKGKLSVSVELYEDKVRKIVILQQRSPCVAGRRGKFIENLLKWVKEVGFKDVVLLTSKQAYTKQQPDRMRNRVISFRYYFAGNVCSGKDICASLKWLHVDDPDPMQNLFGMYNNKEIDFNGQRKMVEENKEEKKEEKVKKSKYPGGGITKTINKQCKDKVDLLNLLVYSNEGDNQWEAKCLASILDSYICKTRKDVKPVEKWTNPCSWDFVFGDPINYQLI